MGTMIQTVQDGIGECGVADGLVPVLDPFWREPLPNPEQPPDYPNTVELSTLTYQIVGRQPFAAETNRVPSRHRDADLPLNLTVFGRPVPLR